jgi:hypothetical protein
MQENCRSGSEGGAKSHVCPYPYLSPGFVCGLCLVPVYPPQRAAKPGISGGASKTRAYRMVFAPQGLQESARRFNAGNIQSVVGWQLSVGFLNLAVGIWRRQIRFSVRAIYFRAKTTAGKGSRIGRINSRFCPTGNRQLANVRISVLLAPLQGASS